MSEANVVRLERPVVNAELVDHLKEALQMAEDGKIVNGAFVGIMPNGGSMTFIPEGSDGLRLLGALAILSADLMKSMSNG